MGEIRKDNLHESLIEELNDLANIDLSGKQDKTDESLLTESKDLVGAINELFQSANNGKELIASAIGEPLNAEDTFSAMSNDINGLLSTFKTNMMNNGITVESSDKFKSLIDKIATMVEEGEGKGIRFETINVTSSSNEIYFIKSQSGNQTLGYNAASLEYNDLKFPPTFIIITYLEKICGVIYNISGDYNVFAPAEASSWIYYQLNVNELTSIGITYYPVRANNNGFKVPVTNTSTLYTCYAIGVGEEDTTLRDSLASILTEEGVSVTEEDDMASLISKVDSEFDRKNANSGKGFNIKCVPSLPNTITNGEIYIIEPEYNHIYIDKESTDDALIKYQFTENDIYVRLLDANSSTSYTTGIINDTITFNYIIGDIYKYISNTLIKCEEIYVGENNAWVSILDVPDELKLFYNGTFASELEGFDYVSLTQTGTTSTYTPSYEIGNYLRLKQSIPYTGQSSNRLISKKTIDLTGYDYLYLDLYTWSDSFTGTEIEVIGKIRINDKNQNELKVLNVEYELIYNGKNYNYSKRYTTKIDLKDITGQCYITISGTIISEEGGYSSGIDIYQLTLGVE